MKSYLDLMKYTLKHGRWVAHERTGTRTLQVVGPQLSFNLLDGFPLVTSRYVPFKNAISEILWFLSGSTDERILRQQKNPVWSLWALTEKDVQSASSQTDPYGKDLYVGSCGPIYGEQWRHWPKHDGTTIDQIQYAMDTLKTNPTSRRLVVSAWNPEYLPDETLSPQENILRGKQALAPCHTLFQLVTQKASIMERYRWMTVNMPFQQHVALDSIVRSSGKTFLNQCRIFTGHFGISSLFSMSDDQFSDFDTQRLHVMFDQLRVPSRILHMKMFARSQDLPLGTVFNIASYALLLTIMAKHSDMIAGTYHHTMTDVHIYENQIEMAREHVKRPTFPLPELYVREGVQSIFDYQVSDFTLAHYEHGDYIKYPITK